MDTAFGAFFATFWRLTAEMAPYLLIGFAVAGLLHVVMDPKWIDRHLGRKGLRQIFKASVIGVPLPLCSCGIIPVAATVRNLGGSRGAVASFTAATPQTGVDSILATGGLISWPFAAIRVVVSIVSGTVCGWLVERFGNTDRRPGSELSEGAAAEEPTGSSCCGGSDSDSGANRKSVTTRLHAGFRYGFGKLPTELHRALFAGLFLATLITVMLPDGWIGRTMDSLAVQYGFALIAALPLYVCSTGSIPLALSLIAAGLSPGAALIFLIVGPATNVATLVALPKIIGPRSTVAYVLGLVGVALASAVVVDSLDYTIIGTTTEMEMGHAVWKQTAAVILIGVLALPLVRSLRAGKKTAASQGSCCH